MRPSSSWASATCQEFLVFLELSFRTRILDWVEVLPTPSLSKVMLLSPGTGFLFNDMHLTNHTALGRNTLGSAGHSFLPTFELPSSSFIPHPTLFPPASPSHSLQLPERTPVPSQLNPHRSPSTLRISVPSMAACMSPTAPNLSPISPCTLFQPYCLAFFKKH